MRTVLNILNFVLGGFLTTLGWLIATLFSIVLIITLPLTRSCWEITKLSLLPYGNEAVHVNELEPGAKSSVMNAGGTLLNIIWLVLFGWWLCLMHIFCGIAQCLTIIGIPVGIIYLVALAKFKIEGRADVEKLTSAPIVGDIPLTDEKQGAIAVFENQNNLMSETFRNVRTNLQFMLENDKKVILVTSTVSGEGKSFISGNLAISLSLLGKKVVIVGLDIRKPGLNKVFNISKREQGITQYLANPEKNLMDLVQLSDVSKNLYILPGGTVPPNPTELLARDGLDKAIETLKKNFDYVILDTAPAGMVTDTLLIGRVADLSVYVCRADYSRKAEFTLINELADSNKLPNLCTVINGLDLQKKKYGYYYGYGKYGKYYGYGKRYGYGYGYGETHHGGKGERTEE